VFLAYLVDIRCTEQGRGGPFKGGTPSAKPTTARAGGAHQQDTILRRAAGSAAREGSAAVVHGLRRLSLRHGGMPPAALYDCCKATRSQVVYHAECCMLYAIWRRIRPSYAAWHRGVAQACIHTAFVRCALRIPASINAVCRRHASSAAQRACSQSPAGFGHARVRGRRRGPSLGADVGRVSRVPV
jgi:hypothetical protein